MSPVPSVVLPKRRPLWAAADTFHHVLCAVLLEHETHRLLPADSTVVAEPLLSVTSTVAPQTVAPWYWQPWRSTALGLIKLPRWSMFLLELLRFYFRLIFISLFELFERLYCPIIPIPDIMG